MFKTFKSYDTLLAPIGMKMVKRYGVLRTESSDGEIHLILSELKLNNDSQNKCEINDKIRKIMKEEAKKPLHLKRGYE